MKMMFYLVDTSGKELAESLEKPLLMVSCHKADRPTH
jgi:hypothetical protein